MNLLNNYFFAKEITMPQIMAEDVGEAELRNPAFYTRTEYKPGIIRRLLQGIG